MMMMIIIMIIIIIITIIIIVIIIITIIIIIITITTNNLKFKRAAILSTIGPPNNNIQLSLQCLLKECYLQQAHSLVLQSVLCPIRAVFYSKRFRSSHCYYYCLR